MRPTKDGRKLSKHAVLANAYVPQSLRAVNEAPATFSLTTWSVHLNNPEKVALVPYTPYCGCSDLHADDDSAKKKLPFPHVFPERKIQSELYYAVEQRKSRELLNGSRWQPLKNNKAESAHAQAYVTADASSLDGYCSVWESLLVQERQETLMLYERYSQYNVRITISHRQIDGSAAVDPMPTASVRIDGIADANPCLQIGDTVLIRPVHALPFQNHHMGGVLEIRATVLSIQRVGGLVRFSWIDNNNYYTASLRNQSFNIRFVPSIQSLERSFSALDWLRSFAKKNDSTEMAVMKFLFPREAPIIPVCNAKALLQRGGRNDDDATATSTTMMMIMADLNRLNATQLSFVNMVMARTLPTSSPKEEEEEQKIDCTNCEDP